jgi:hypothetical protein
MATKSVDASKMMLRMSDFVSEPKRMLPPITDYEKEPLVPLEQTVKPLLSLVPDVEEMVRTVKQNCQHPQNHLSSDESASIMLYTLEWMPRKQSFFFILNQTLRSQNREELLPWFLFLRLFIFALSKLPSTTHRIIYYGIKMDLSQEFTKGKTFIWWTFSSCSSSIKFLEQFLGESGHRTIFNIECDSAKDISQHSFYQSENEVLMYPARQFQVVSSFNSGNQMKIIHLKEIQPPFPLIHISQTSSIDTYENEQLQQRIEQCQSRSKVDLSEQNLNDEDMKIVIKEAIINKQCTELDLSNNKITSVGASMIAEALNNNTTLEWLYLTENRLCDRGVHSLAQTLSFNNSNIDILGLRGTSITNESAEYLAEMLKINTKLKCLLLGCNEISDRGVEILANTLIHHNTTLLSLRVVSNKLVSDSSVDVLVEMLKQNRTLKRVDIENCNLFEKGKDRLREIAKSKTDFELEI